MKSFTLLSNEETYLFSLFEGDSVVFHKSHIADGWHASCDGRRIFFTKKPPTTLIQEVYNFLTGKITWEKFGEESQKGEL
jgi:hypothetical protein